MTDWPLNLIGEIQVDGAWERVPMRVDPKVTVSRGMSAEGSEPTPGTTSVNVDNRDAKYSPRNPESPLFGKIGRNTPFRLRVDNVTAQTPVVTDTFSRTTANGWGTASSGQAWALWNPYTVAPASAYSTAPGTGRIKPINTTGRYIRMPSVNMADLDATFTLQTDAEAQGVDGEGAIFGSFLARIGSVNTNYYAFNVGFRTDTGLLNGQGLRVAVNIVKHTSSVASAINTQKPVPGLAYTAGAPINVRVQCQGPNLRMRVWSAGAPEPQAWHSQAWDTDHTTGAIGFLTFIDAAPLTSAGFDIRVGALNVRPLPVDNGAIRMQGEIPSWTPADRDEAGVNLTVALEPSGILRRLGAGRDPLKSAMRRFIPSLHPTAYIPFEEGKQGDRRAADATLRGNTGPMEVTGFDFAKDSDLLGSNPLPVLTSSARMILRNIPGSATSSWSVGMAYRIPADKAPTVGMHELLKFNVAGGAASQVLLTLETSGGLRIRISVYDSSGDLVGTNTASDAGSASGGGPTLTGGWRTLTVRAQPDAVSGTNYSFVWADLDGLTWGNSVTVTPGVAGRVNRVDTQFGVGLAGMGIGHFTVWGVAFNSAYNYAFTGLGYASTQGLRGETTRAFLDRLSSQEDVPLEITGAGADRLGPVPPGDYLGIVSQVVATDMGLLYETRSSLSLAYRTRESLYNQPIDLALDYSNGEVFAPFNPVDDDKTVRNRITVKRREGSEVTVEQTTGPLSISPPPLGSGVVSTSFETIVDQDSQLLQQAAWRLSVATVDEMRVTKLTLKMGNPRMRPLIDAVLALDTGSRIVIDNLPDDLPPEGFDLRVIGYTEEFAFNEWNITFTCVSATMWTVGVPDDALLGRADTDGTSLRSAVTNTQTSWPIAVTDGPVWITTATHPTEFPFSASAGGEEVTVTAITSAVSDAFGRTASSGWGTADLGGSWSVALGTASDFSVASNYGIITLTSNSASRIVTIPSSTANTEIFFDIATSALATGASIHGMAVCRYIDVSNYYMARLEFTPARDVILSLRKRVAGVDTQLATYTTGLLHTASSFYRIRFLIKGADLFAKAWHSSSEEPATWHALATDTTHANGASLGFRSISDGANTNVNPQVRFDNFAVVNPQIMTVVRSVNGVVKAHAAGASLNLTYPMRSAL